MERRDKVLVLKLVAAMLMIYFSVFNTVKADYKADIIESAQLKEPSYGSNVNMYMMAEAIELAVRSIKNEQNDQDQVEFTFNEITNNGYKFLNKDGFIDQDKQKHAIELYKEDFLKGIIEYDNYDIIECDLLESISWDIESLRNWSPRVEPTYLTIDGSCWTWFIRVDRLYKDTPDIALDLKYSKIVTTIGAPYDEFVFNSKEARDLINYGLFIKAYSYATTEF